jgi:V/A-type H+-transporting ATPase subunit F
MTAISDNQDLCIGMRLAGIEGIFVKNRSEMENALEKSFNHAGIIILSRQLAEEFPESIKTVRTRFLLSPNENRRSDNAGPLLVTL